MKKVKVNIGGQAVEAEAMTFNMIEDPWSICRLKWDNIQGKACNFNCF